MAEYVESMKSLLWKVVTLVTLLVEEK